MAKFKKGDKVRIVRGKPDIDFSRCFELNQIVVIKDDSRLPFAANEKEPEYIKGIIREECAELIDDFNTFNTIVRLDSEFRNGRWIGVDTAVDYTRSFQEYINKTNKKPIMTRISNMMKKLLDADTQTLVKAGYINGDLELTEAGRLALTTIVFMEKKAEMVKMAEEKLAEEKE